MPEVQASGWREQVAAAQRAGFTFLNFLTAIDEIGRTTQLRVELRLNNPGSGEGYQLWCYLDREQPILADIADIYPGASWLQRQIRDYFGVTFSGGDNRPLLVHAGGAPLRKSRLLEARIESTWPGAVEPGSATASPGRRKLLPPGVPDPTLLAADATESEIAQSASGLKVRKRS